MLKRVSAHRIYPPLFSRYVEQDPRVVALFNGEYWEKEIYCRRAFFLQTRSFPQEARELLIELNRSLPAQFPPGWEGKLRDRRTLFVITGQQPGLFAGPLLVLYKALAAVKLANFLEAELQLPVLPLFWSASEDHNVNPMVQSYFPLCSGGLTRVCLTLLLNGLPAGMTFLDNEAVAVLLEQVAGFYRNGLYEKEVIAWLRSSAQQGENNLAGWFLQIISHLFSGTGLVFFDPLQAAARGFYIPLLFQALEHSPSLQAKLDEAEKKLRAASFPVQVKRRGKESLIMIVFKDKRYSLLKEGECYYTPGGELSLSRNELLSMIVERPNLFSPGVLLRPLFQDCLFPTLAYVAGPAEAAYFAQIKGLYPFFNLEMPPLYPRPGITLITPPVQDLVAKVNLDLDMFPEGLRNEQGQIQHKGKVGSILCHNLWPRNRPQERVFSILPYLIDYGFGFWRKFCHKFPLEPGHYLFCWKEGK